VLTRAAPATADLLLQPVRPVVRLRPPPPPPVAAQIVELEQAFAAASRERGARAAFLEVLADDAIVLQPGPVFGRAQWESSPDVQGTLDWAPDRAQASAAGDLGIATGPWLLTPRAGGAPLAGRYLTVWRRSEVGWRVVFDGGFGRTAAAGAKLPATAPALDFGNCEPGSPVELAVLHDFETGGTADAATPPGRRLAQLAGANLAWFEQPQAAGLAGAAAARQLLALPARQVLRPMGGAVAASGDLGYTYGLVEPAPGSAANAAYANVWCRQGGEWKLLLGLRRSLAGG
jgi:ketosteroid isomerase-like protein